MKTCCVSPQKNFFVELCLKKFQMKFSGRMTFIFVHLIRRYGRHCPENIYKTLQNRLKKGWLGWFTSRWWIPSDFNGATILKRSGKNRINVVIERQRIRERLSKESRLNIGREALRIFTVSSHTSKKFMTNVFIKGWLHLWCLAPHPFTLEQHRQGKCLVDKKHLWFDQWFQCC